jgi:hypothetical protein
MVVYNYDAAVETMLVTAAEGLASIGVVRSPDSERTVDAVAEFEDIVVVDFVDVESPLETEHTVAVNAAEVLEQGESSLWILEGVALHNSRQMLPRSVLVAAIPG